MKENRNEPEARRDRKYLWLPTVLAISVMTALAQGGELVEMGSDFRVERNFRSFSIPADSRILVLAKLEAEQETRIGVDAELQRYVEQSLRERLKIVTSKEEAEFLVQLRLVTTPVYAIKNAVGESARGLVMLSLCSHPIKVVEHDCQNLTYFYFGNVSANAALAIVLPMWAERVIRPK